MDVELPDGRDTGIGNTSATTSAGKVVGDSMELNDLELYGLVSIAGSTIFSWASIATDLKLPTTSKIQTRY